MAVIVPLPKEMRITDKFSIKRQFLGVFGMWWQGILAQKWQDGSNGHRLPVTLETGNFNVYEGWMLLVYYCNNSEEIWINYQRIG
jgi:hypothetical protein